MKSLVLSQALTKEEVNIPEVSVTQTTVADVLSLVFGLAGAIALIIVIIGGIQYALSQGEPQATAKAKNTILYAVIGLVIAALAFNIVRFVIGRVG